jgi:hypothetical protein
MWGSAQYRVISAERNSSYIRNMSTNQVRRDASGVHVADIRTHGWRDSIEAGRSPSPQNITFLMEKEAANAPWTIRVGRVGSNR